MHTVLPLSAPSCAPAPNVQPLEFAFTLRPIGWLMMLAEVPCLEPFRTLPPDTRLWLRWIEPAWADAEIVIASSVGDEGAPTARVLARACVPDRRGAWALFRVAQAQGVVDLKLVGSTTADGSPSEVLHLFVHIEGSHEVGSSVDPLPGRPQ